MSITLKQKSDYQANGFVVLPQLIEQSHVAELREIFDRLFSPPDDGSKPPYYDLIGANPDAEITQSSVPQLQRPSRRVPELIQTRAWQAALDVAMALLEVGDYTRDDLVVRDHAIMKPPHSTGATNWHQDEAYWDADNEWNELSIWIALQDTSEEMGCMQFMPGSHKRGVVKHHAINVYALEMDLEQLDESVAQICPLPMGGATVHNCRTLHYTTGNQSDIARHAFILTIGTPPKQRGEP